MLLNPIVKKLILKAVLKSMSSMDFESLMVNAKKLLQKGKSLELSDREKHTLKQEYEAMKKHPAIAFYLSCFLGWLAIGRFYIGNYRFATAKLIILLFCFSLAYFFFPVFFVGFLIWFVDLFKILKATEAKNIQKFEQIYSKLLMQKAPPSQQVMPL